VTLLDERPVNPHGRTEADALIEEARQRQRKRRWFIGSIVLIVVVAAGVWVASGGISGTKPPSPANKPGHIKTPSGAPGSATPSGKLNTQTHPVGNVVVSANGRTITTMAIDECGREPTLLARSYPNRVTLAVVGPVLPRNAICPANLEVSPVHTTLSAPLGNRLLVEASSGKPVASFDASHFARLTVLPSGCRLGAGLPAGANFSPVKYKVGETRDCTYAGSISTWVPLVVTQMTGNAASSPGNWPVVGHPSVNGHRATLRVAASSGSGVYVRSLNWEADGYTFVVMSVLGNEGQTLLASGQLLAIADGLRP
jgi:hypothetical protein